MPFALRTLLLLALPLLSHAATLSDPQVDACNMRVGTQTFSGLYQFTSENLLVETARAMTNMGSDIIKLYLGSNFSGKYHSSLPSNVTNLMTLVRDEPNCRYVFDMPFRHIIAWAYPLSLSDAPFLDGNYSASDQAKDYREMYDLTRYLLTNYTHSGKTFYLGHWEGDGYLDVQVNGVHWATNPSPAVVASMIQWENNRQKAVDDAKAATAFSDVNVFYYLEVNRVRDAMKNGPSNNVRVANAVLPYVTNLDFVSYSSYDAMNLSSDELYATLRYIEANTPPVSPAKAGTLPATRLWIGEYGWGGSQTPAQQEPTTRAYFQRLLGYTHPLPFILFWEIYDNELNSDGSYRNYFLIDPNNNKTPCFYLHQWFINGGRLAVARFKERNGRLPTDSEFAALMLPRLDVPLPTPTHLTVANLGATLLTRSSLALSGSLSQGVYGDEAASVWVYFGAQDAGTAREAWEQKLCLGLNTNFNPTTFSTVLTNLPAATNLYFRFYATNASGEAWAPASAQVSLQPLDPAAFTCRLKLAFTGYRAPETLVNFPALINFSTNLPGFSYRQFASPIGGDLRFTDAGGLQILPHEIDEWNTNGTSAVWVRVPQLAGTNDYLWAYWGNPNAATLPASSTNGSVWAADHLLVWHLKENSLPYADSARKYPATTGNPPLPAAGLVGQAGRFDGATDYLNAGPVSLGSNFTLSAWVRLDPTATNIQTLLANKAGGWNSAGFAWSINSYNTADQQLRLETGDGVNGKTGATTSGAVPAGSWHHVAAVVDQGAGAARLFVDGVDRTQPGASAVLAGFPVQTSLQLGRFTNSSYYLKGTLDEVRVETAKRSSNWLWASWMTVASNAVLTTYSPVNPQPYLSLSSTTNTLMLSWPYTAGVFTLCTTTNLQPPVTWTPVPTPPLLVNGQWQFPLPTATPGAACYRLQQ